MGEISDSIIAGEVCALCMTSFDDDAGYPVVCSDCYSKDCGYQIHPDEKTSKHLHTSKGKPTTGANAVKGIVNFLKGKGLHEDDLDLVTAKYCREFNLVDTTREDRYNYIQKDFGKFVKWFKKTYK